MAVAILKHEYSNFRKINNLVWPYVHDDIYKILLPVRCYDDKTDDFFVKYCLDNCFEMVTVAKHKWIRIN